MQIELQFIKLTEECIHTGDPMNCWHCERPAHGVCRFCGRAVCKQHAKSLPYIIDIIPGENGEYRALVVGDTLYCGVCKPKEDLVDLTDLMK